MARVGLLTFSDGRDFVHADIKTFGQDVEGRIAQALEQAGHEVIRATEPIWTNTLATTEARRVADARPDLTIFNYPVWAFPHFSMLAATASPGPLLLFSNIDPQFPGMVGMLAAGGGLDQIGRQHTAVADTDQWMSTFGVDVEEIDQWEIVRRSESVEQSRVTAGREWLERHAAGVHYDGKQLTHELLERQIRSYHAVRKLIDEWNLDFRGIKGQPELTTHFTTM